MRRSHGAAVSEVRQQVKVSRSHVVVPIVTINRSHFSFPELKQILERGRFNFILCNLQLVTKNCTKNKILSGRIFILCWCGSYFKLNTTNLERSGSGVEH